MHLLYLTHSVTWSGGGIFFNAYHQAKLLTQRGHQVTLLSISPFNRWRFVEKNLDGIRLVETPDWLSGKARSGWDMYDTLRRVLFVLSEKYDLVHAFESRPVAAVPGVLTRVFKHTPLVYTWADWFGRGGKGEERGKLFRFLTGPLETFCEDYFMPRGDFCVAMGRPLMERALGLGISGDQVTSILHGCDTANLKPGDKLEARRVLGLPGEAFILGYLGVLRPSSADLLFRSFELVRQKLNLPCRLILIGNHKLDLEKRLRSSIAQDVLETRWVPYEKINLFLNACDQLALPLMHSVSTDNVWPSKLNDYLCVGRPVIATRMRVLEMEKFLQGSLAFCQDTPEAFSERCLEVFNSAEEQLRLGESARRAAVEHLSWPLIVDQLQNIYQSIFSKQG
jgi:glycosyltransferase involved in cell wall biosynthesis